MPIPADVDRGPDEVRATVTTTKDWVRALGGSFMKSPEARRAASELGLPRLTYYFRGRGGVLGSAETDVVAAVFAFFPAETVRARWPVTPVTPGGPAVTSPAEFTRHYAGVCHAWGRRCLAGLAGAERLAGLLERVADGADAAGQPLFAGWRATPRPDDPAARVAHLSHVLREHRGGVHLPAVLVRRLTPLQATLARDHGAERARFLGWEGPFPRLDETVHERRAAAEALTDEMAAPAYRVLSGAELGELRELLQAAWELARARHRDRRAWSTFADPPPAVRTV